MENWVNGTVREINQTDSTLYYSQQSKNPLIADCEPTILYSHAKVSLMDYSNWCFKIKLSEGRPDTL